MTKKRSALYDKLRKAEHEAHVAEHGFRERAKKALRDALHATLKADVAEARKERTNATASRARAKSSPRKSARKLAPVSREATAKSLRPMWQAHG